MSDKPFPMPGTAWRWLGDPRFDPRPSGPHIVASLRWFRDRTEVVFAHGESCAGVEHLMQSDAWEYVPQAHDLTPSEAAPTKIVITRRFADYHAAIDGTNGCKWGCGKTIDEAVGNLVRNHPGVFGAIVDLEKAGVL